MPVRLAARMVSPVLLAAALAGQAAAATAPLRFIDAHSHLVAAVTPAQEIALFREAGMAGVIIMSSDMPALQAVAKANPGYVIPFASVSRMPTGNDVRLSETVGAQLTQLKRQNTVCGFGEMGTRPNPENNDAAAIGNQLRAQVFDAGAAEGVPVNIHVQLDTPEVVKAVEGVVASRPKLSLILAHAGWGAGPEVVGPMLAAHPNLYADLSVRLDPPRRDGLSILTADGQLQPAWRALIERFPDRFLFAMDVTGADRHTRIAELLGVARKALAPLPDDIQQKVAHGNIERLLDSCRPA